MNNDIFIDSELDGQSSGSVQTKPTTPRYTHHERDTSDLPRLGWSEPAGNNRVFIAVRYGDLEKGDRYWIQTHKNTFMGTYPKEEERGKEVQRPADWVVLVYRMLLVA